jgi:hypothetical protein
VVSPTPTMAYLSRRYFGVVASVSAGSGICVSPSDVRLLLAGKRLNAMAGGVNAPANSRAEDEGQTAMMESL